jgi:hypothetical protein
VKRRGNRNDKEREAVFFRHCEEHSDDAIQQAPAKVLQRESTLDGFATTRNDERASFSS